MNNEMKTPLKNPYITVNYYIYQNFEMMRSLTEVPDPTVRGAAPSGALQTVARLIQPTQRAAIIYFQYQNVHNTFFLLFRNASLKKEAPKN